MGSAILLVTLTMTLCGSNLGLNMHDRLASKSQLFVDVVFTDGLLFAVSARSTLHCAAICRNTHGCLSFTFTKNTSPADASCRGHTSWMTSGMVSQPAADTRAYMDEGWLYDACSVDADCPAIHSQCFSGKCVCTPGYYFSHSGRSCVAACAQADLGVDFVYYPNSRIRNNNVYEDFRSLDSCKALCRGTFATQCRTIDYRFSDGRCILGQVTAVDVPGSWDLNIHDHDHHQVTCA